MHCCLLNIFQFINIVHQMWFPRTSYSVSGEFWLKQNRLILLFPLIWTLYLCWCSLVYKSHCWFKFSLCATTTVKLFSHILLVSYISPIPSFHIWFFLPKFRTSCLFPVELLLIVYFSNLLKSFWILILSSKVLASPPSLVSSVNLVNSPYCYPSH